MADDDRKVDGFVPLYLYAIAVNLKDGPTNDDEEVDNTCEKEKPRRDGSSISFCFCIQFGGRIRQ